MFFASVLSRKLHQSARAASGSRGHYDRHRLLRFEALDDRLLLSVTTPSAPVNLSTGPASAPSQPQMTTFFDNSVVAAPTSPGTTAQTAFPTPDLLLANVPKTPVPVFVPDSKGWVFQAGGGGFLPPSAAVPLPPLNTPAPIDASDNDYPIALETAPDASVVSLVQKPVQGSEAAIDSVLAQFPDHATQADIAESSAAQRDGPSADLSDVVMASAEDWDQPSVPSEEMSAAAVSAS
ncbi:MAG TPA: hypothetical protein VIK18_14520, partial [Pirellulales bacterium]